MLSKGRVTILSNACGTLSSRAARLAELDAAGVGVEVEAAAAVALQPQQGRRVVGRVEALRERVRQVGRDRRVERARAVYLLRAHTAHACASDMILAWEILTTLIGRSWRKCARPLRQCRPGLCVCEALRRCCRAGMRAWCMACMACMRLSKVVQSIL